MPTAVSSRVPLSQGFGFLAAQTAAACLLTTQPQGKKTIVTIVGHLLDSPLLIAFHGLICLTRFIGYFLQDLDHFPE